MAQKEVFKIIKGLLKLKNLAVLATHGSKYPYGTLVGYSETINCREIFFATNKDTNKYRNIKKNPHVSLLIYDIKDTANDFKEGKALTVLGHANEVKNKLNSIDLRVYLKKHPYLEEFVKNPNCSLIKIRVKKYLLVRNFQSVTEYSF